MISADNDGIVYEWQANVCEGVRVCVLYDGINQITLHNFIHHLKFMKVRGMFSYHFTFCH